MNDKTKTLKTPGNKEEEEADAKDDEDLDTMEATTFRGVAARLNYLAQDRADVQFAAKEVCREMAKPTRSSWRKQKRVARYLVDKPEVVFKYPYQEGSMEIKVFTDSDWAGCRTTRESTSGGVILLGGHCIKTWSSTQGSIALSSCEAEFYAMVDGILKALGLRACVEELGFEPSVRVWTDSSAAKSFVSRRGLGKIRHIETKWLWVQEALSRKRFEVAKIDGKVNPADPLTKYLTFADLNAKLERIGLAARATSVEEGC